MSRTPCCLIRAFIAALILFLSLMTPRPLAETSVTVRFVPEAVTFPNVDGGFGSEFVADRSEAFFANNDLRDGLDEFDVKSFTTIAPFFRHLSGTQVVCVS